MMVLAVAKDGIAQDPILNSPGRDWSDHVEVSIQGQEVPMVVSWLMTGLLAAGQASSADAPRKLPPVVIPAAPASSSEVVPVRQDVTPLIPPNTTSPYKELEEGIEAGEEKEHKLFLMKVLEGSAFESAGLSARGYTEFNYNISNLTGQSVARNNLPQAMNYMGNQFMMEQTSLTVEKLLDYEKSEFQWGFNLTALAGTDYRFTVSNNLADSQLRMNDGLPNTYGIDPMTQGYVNAWLPNLGAGTEVKAGKFWTIIFNESIDPTLNKTVSRAQTFMANPFTHTGVLATTKLNDRWTINNGAVMGADVFFGPVARFNYLGGIKWESEGANTSLAFNTMIGPAEFLQDLNAANNFDVFEILFSHNFLEKWNYTLDVMYSFENGFVGNVTNRDGTVRVLNQEWAPWYGFVNYLTYNINDKWSTTSRVEFFDDAKGVRTGFVGLYSTFTQAVTWKIKEGFWFRTELRYDYAQSRAFQGNHGLFTLPLDFIIRY